MAMKTTAPSLDAYADLSPSNGVPLTKGKPQADWFGSVPADTYVMQLLQRFEERNPAAAAELAALANEAKWSTGWKGFGRNILEVLG